MTRAANRRNHSAIATLCDACWFRAHADRRFRIRALREEDCTPRPEADIDNKQRFSPQLLAESDRAGSGYAIIVSRMSDGVFGYTPLYMFWGHELLTIIEHAGTDDAAGWLLELVECVQGSTHLDPLYGFGPACECATGEGLA